jgi:hypothetical protein
MSNSNLTYTNVKRTEINKELYWKSVWLNHSNSFALNLVCLAENDRIIGVYRPGIQNPIALDENFKEHLKFIQDNWHGVLVSSDELNLWIAKTALSNVERAKSDDQTAQPSKEQCLHLTAQVRTMSKAHCSTCDEQVEPRLVVLNLAEKIQEVNEFMWSEQERVKSEKLAVASEPKPAE